MFLERTKKNIFLYKSTLAFGQHILSGLGDEQM